MCEMKGEWLIMAVVRKGSLNARQRARLAVQAEQEKIKRQVDLFTEALTAVDARDQTEVRLGHALNELRGMGLSRADIAERTGLAAREVSAAMRAATADIDVADDANEAEEGDVEVASETDAAGSDNAQDFVHGEGDQDVANGDLIATEVDHSADPVHAQ